VSLLLSVYSLDTLKSDSSYSSTVSEKSQEGCDNLHSDYPVFQSALRL
jgi:hypothetical protein